MEWPSNSTAAVEQIRRILDGDPKLAEAIRAWPAGAILLQEGEQPRQLLLLLEGSVTLHKGAEDGSRVNVDRLETGDLLGILSYVAREQVYVGAIAATEVRAFVLDWNRFENLQSTHPDLHRLLQQLTVENLARRYRRMIRLHLDLAAANQKLETERTELHSTLAELEQTRNRLIHQEKLATLGQLTAGLAHELNNPAAALIRSVDYLRENIDSLLETRPESAVGHEARLWALGLESTAPDSDQRREKMERLEKDFPTLPRPLLRRLSAVPDEALAALLPAKGERPAEPRILRGLLLFEAGYFVRSLNVAAERIRRLVISLRNYSREGSSGMDKVDVRAGLQDTLLIVANRLKNVETELHLGETPPVAGDAGELNQVWTNLVVNACDAMGETGRLRIDCGTTPEGKVFVTVADTGPGVPDLLREKIFEPNFTTKTSATNFGLGLGLAISRGIILKHDGTLAVHNAPEGGAVFTVTLPAVRLPRSG